MELIGSSAGVGKIDLRGVKTLASTMAVALEQAACPGLAGMRFLTGSDLPTPNPHAPLTSILA